MYVREFNPEQAESILFLHGGGVGGWMWEKQVEALSNYHCIIPDLPGHGGSREIRGFTIKNCAEALANLIAKAGHENKAHVVGHSLGAQILVQLLADYPELIHSAVINSALVRPLGKVAAWIKPTVQITLPLARKRWFAKLQAQTLQIPEEFFARYYEESQAIEAETLTQILLENASFKLPKNLKKSKVPTLVLVGEKERSMMLKSANDLINSISSAQGYIVNGVGHSFNFEAPVLYNKVLQAWLAGKPLPSEGLIPISGL